MHHSTAKKYLELVDTLFKAAPFKVYPNETIPRSIKILGFDSPYKEASKNSADNQAHKMRRDLKPLNEFAGVPKHKLKRYVVRKEYLTAEEVNKRLEENPEQYEFPHSSYFQNVAGWHFWIEEIPSQEEQLSMLYQQEVLEEKQSQQLPEETNEEIDYG